MGPAYWIGAGLLMALGGVVQGAVGFGFSLVVLPILLIFRLR